MVKLVLTQSNESTYDDEPGVRYHFGEQYVRRVRAGQGDFAVIYQSRRGRGLMSYIGYVRIGEVVPDTNRDDHYFVDLEYIQDFPTPVPFRDGEVFLESILRKSDGSVNRGALGNSVRELPEDEFDMILRAGFAPDLARVEQPVLGFAEPEIDFERPTIEVVSQRLFRDKVFSRNVMKAYDATCALTGIRMINGGGASEAEAAHIKPVAERGPDMIQNGLSLSRTVHWLFDRGYLSLQDDFKILRASSGTPDFLDRVLIPNGVAVVPSAANDRPHPAFLRWHRENKFKG